MKKEECCGQSEQHRVRREHKAFEELPVDKWDEGVRGT